MFPLPSSLYAAWVRGTYIYLRKDVYYVFVFGISRTSRLFDQKSKNKAMVDVYEVCNIPLCTFAAATGVFCCYTYRRGLSQRCSFRFLWAMRRPLICRTSNRYRFPRFFFLYELIFNLL